MSEPIIITAIIVSGIVALAWLLLRFAFKAWSAERADSKVADEKLAAVTPVKQSPINFHAIFPEETTPEMVKAMVDRRIRGDFN